MKDIQPTVSVIVPNYNYAPYLKQRLDSILNQTYQDFELILLDDASSDNSVDVLEQYRDNEHVTHFVVNKTNSGSPFIQWKKGIEMAKGKYIWIAESDDWADLTFLEKCVDKLNDHPDAAYCFTNAFFVNDEGEKYQEKWAVKHLIYPPREYQVYDGKKYAARHLYWYNYVFNASSVVFRKDIAMKVDFGRYTNMKFCGDWQFWTDMALGGKVIAIFENLDYFRRHSRCTTNNGFYSTKDLPEIMAIAKFIEDAVPIGSYKKLVRHGELYKEIRHRKMDAGTRKEMDDEFDRLFGQKRLCYYTRKLNNVLLFLALGISYQKDRIKD